MGDNGPSKKVANSLVAVSSAAVLAVYGAGYARTRAAADRLSAHASDRRPHIPVRRDSGAVRAADPAGDAGLKPGPSAASGQVRLKADPATEAKADPATGAPQVRPKPDATTEKDIEVRLKPDATTEKDMKVRLKADPTTEAKADSTTGAKAHSTTEKDAQVRLQADARNETYVGSGFSRTDSVAGDTAPSPIPPSSTPSASADPAAAAPAAASKYKDGTYLGWGSCRHGDIQVSVVIEAGRITAARVAQCLTRYSCSWVDPIPPVIIKQQGTTYDYVSGATESSDAFQDAVADALSHAL